jgi:hypothetical protein
MQTFYVNCYETIKSYVHVNSTKSKCIFSFQTVLTLLVAILVPKDCHGVVHYNRAYWGASPSKNHLQHIPVGEHSIVVLHPTDTGYCNYPGCKNVIKAMQNREMRTLKFNDIGYK